MSPWSSKKGFRPVHLTAAFLLLAVFALPLHFHFITFTAQLGQECACYHGSRTQTALAPAEADRTPAFQASFIDLQQPQVFVSLSFDSHAIRAPPIFISL